MSDTSESRARDAARALHFGPLCNCNHRTKPERPEGCAICCGNALAAHAASEVALALEAARLQCNACHDLLELNTWDDHADNADDIRSGVHKPTDDGLRDFHGFDGIGEPIWCNAALLRALAAQRKGETT